MKFHRILATLTLAGALTMGFAGVAGAQTTDPTPSTTVPVHKLNCDTARDRLAKLEKHDDAVRARIAKAEARRDKLQAEGQTVKAAELTKHIEAAKDRLSKLDARIAKLKSAIATRCSVDPAANN